MRVESPPPPPPPPSSNTTTTPPPPPAPPYPPHASLSFEQNRFQLYSEVSAVGASILENLSSNATMVEAWKCFLVSHELRLAHKIVDIWDDCQDDHTRAETKSSAGEYKEMGVTEMDLFLSYAYGYLASQGILDFEPFAMLYFSWITVHPLVVTGCCRRKVCHRCHCVGHHEDYGGSCVKANAMSSTYLKSHPCPKCNVSLVKTEGCTSVTCPACWHEFRWNEKTSTHATWLQRMRGDGSRNAAVGTVTTSSVSTYIRTETGWLRVTN